MGHTAPAVKPPTPTGTPHIAPYTVSRRSFSAGDRRTPRSSSDIRAWYVKNCAGILPSFWASDPPPCQALLLARLMPWYSRSARSTILPNSLLLRLLVGFSERHFKKDEAKAVPRWTLLPSLKGTRP